MCVWEKREVGEYLEVKGRLRQISVMFPSLLIFLDQVVKDVNER